MNTQRRTPVLFVDDDTDFFATVKEWLTLHTNMDVETALSSEKALEQMKKRRPNSKEDRRSKKSLNSIKHRAFQPF